MLSLCAFPFVLNVSGHYYDHGSYYFSDGDFLLLSIMRVSLSIEKFFFKKIITFEKKLFLLLLFFLNYILLLLLFFRWWLSLPVFSMHVPFVLNFSCFSSSYHFLAYGNFLSLYSLCVLPLSSICLIIIVFTFEWSFFSAYAESSS